MDFEIPSFLIGLLVGVALFKFYKDYKARGTLGSYFGK